jgi:hypothetical protein
MKSFFIIGGDFHAKNTHWGPKFITTKGLSYTRLLQTLDGRSSILANQRIGPQIKKQIQILFDFYVVENISTNYIKI